MLSRGERIAYFIVMLIGTVACVFALSHFSTLVNLCIVAGVMLFMYAVIWFEEVYVGGKYDVYSRYR